MAWGWLILSGLLEVAWSQSIKPTANFTRPLATQDLTPAPGTIIVFSDLWCSFAHLAVHRLHTTRHRLGLDGSQLRPPRIPARAAQRHQQP